MGPGSPCLQVVQRDLVPRWFSGLGFTRACPEDRHALQKIRSVAPVSLLFLCPPLTHECKDSKAVLSMGRLFGGHRMLKQDCLQRAPGLSSVESHHRTACGCSLNGQKDLGDQL